MRKALLGVSVVAVLWWGAAAAISNDSLFDSGTKALFSVDAPVAVPDAPTSAEFSLPDGRVWAVFEAATREERTRLAAAGVSIEEVVGSRLAGTVDRATLAALRGQGANVVDQAGLDAVFPLDFPEQDQRYHNYDEALAHMKETAAAAPDLVSLFSIGSSVQGREIPVLRFNADARGAAASERPGIVFLGTHHAREHLSTEIPLMLARWLVEHREDPRIKTLLATRDVFIAPVVNPDGLEHDIATGRYRMHRKNMRRNDDGTLGVDLNRNYGYMWGTGGSSANPRSDTYMGPEPFSEPESRAVRDFVVAHPNLKILLSYHTFSELILYPWGHKYDPIEDGRALAAYKAMAQTMAGMTGYTPEQSSDLYIASGDTTDWSWGERGIFSFTFELTPKSMWNGGFYPGAGVIDSTFAKNVEPALYLIGLADDPYRASENRLSKR